MKNELIDVTNALIFALKIDGRKDIANTELIAEAERIVKLFAIPVVMVELACPRCGSTNTAPSDKENDAGCYDCGFVWQDN